VRQKNPYDKRFHRASDLVRHARAIRQSNIALPEVERGPQRSVGKGPVPRRAHLPIIIIITIHHRHHHHHHYYHHYYYHHHHHHHHHHEGPLTEEALTRAVTSPQASWSHGSPFPAPAQGETLASALENTITIIIIITATIMMMMMMIIIIITTTIIITNIIIIINNNIIITTTTTIIIITPTS
jgi:hypothetical protein